MFMLFNSRTVQRVVALSAVAFAVMGGFVPESEATISYPLDQQGARRIQIGPGLGQTTVVSPTTPIADFDQSISEVLGQADGTGQVSFATATQRSILGADRIDVRSFIDAYRAQAPLNQGVLRVVAQSVCNITFDLSEPSSFAFYYHEFTSQGFQVGANVSLRRLTSGPEILLGVVNQSNPTQFGTLQPGRYGLSIGAAINSDLGLGLGRGTAVADATLVIPSAGSAALAGVVGGSLLQRERRRGDLAK